MRAPGFWARGRGGLAAAALTPLSLLWAGVTRRRLASGAWLRAGVPIVCVGNLTVGGSGKTPTVIAIVERLAASGMRPAIIMRGYRGRLAGPVRVDPSRHDAEAVGDEALLLAAWAPVWVGRDRAAAAAAARAAGADVLVLDDGFQNPSLHKDIALVVVDGAEGFGNGRVVPAGPLREPVAEGLARADLILLVGAHRDLLAQYPDVESRPRLQGRIEPLATGMVWQGLRVLAFAGIGRPEKFFASLRGLGVELAASRAFGDHEPYRRAILERLEREAASLRAQLVTTEKDAARLPAGFRRKVMVLPVRMVVEDWSPFDARMEAALRAIPRAGARQEQPPARREMPPPARS